MLMDEVIMKMISQEKKSRLEHVYFLYPGLDYSFQHPDMNSGIGRFYDIVLDMLKEKWICSNLAHAKCLSFMDLF